MRRRLRMLNRFALILLCTPAVAFEPPAGCEGKLTVQSRNCALENIYTCTQDAPGEQWLASFDAVGMTRLMRVDSEFQWLETWYTNPPLGRRIMQPAPDPESVTELLATGEDHFDFSVVMSNGGVMRIQGFDRLTGDEVVIDGETLLRTEYAFSESDAEGGFHAVQEGRQYISPTHRLFFFGTAWDPAEGPESAVHADPVEFIYPGEPGFFASKPIYGCGDMIS